MPTMQWTDVNAAQRQSVAAEFVTMFENNAPTYRFFDTMEEAEINEGMLRIRMETGRAGGHSAYRAGASDFGEYFAPSFDSMFVAPVGYALPRLQAGAVIRGLQKNQQDVLYKQAQLDAAHYAAATKRCNRMLQGDGTGRLAVAS